LFSSRDFRSFDSAIMACRDMPRQIQLRREQRVPITRIDHVQLAMPAGGEELARAFYGRALGIEEVPKPANLAKRGGCWFERGDLKIHLGVEADFRPARKAHLALLAADLARLVKELRASGYTLKDDEPLEGYHRVYVDDPFGNRIELMEPKRA
jgi:catechol 2,3-dioxygenase-like lactoylglutathione lyase family enzyme